MSFLVDSFTEGSTVNLTAHTPETGGAWSKQTGYTNDLNVSGGNGYATGATTGTALYRNAAAPASADYSVEAIAQTTASTDGYMGVIGRCDGAASTLYHFYYAGSARYQLDKVVAGVSSNLGGYNVILSPSTDVTLKLEMVGTSIKGYVDGIERISVTDSSITAAGFAGIRARNTGRIYNLVAAEIGGSATATISATLGALTFAGSSHVSPAAAVAATLGDLTFAGSSSSGTATAAISATIADLAFAGSSAGAGTITMLGFAELTTGADRVSDTGITVCVNHRTTGELVVQLTGQTSDGSGVCAISDPALVAGTAYRVYQEFPDGTIGCWIYTAS